MLFLFFYGCLAVAVNF